MELRNFEELGKELERSGRSEQLKKLAESADGQRLSRMMDADKVERAVRSGDGEAMQALLSQVLSTQEGKRLAADLSKLLGSDPM